MKPRRHPASLLGTLLVIGGCASAPSWGTVQDAAEQSQRVHCRGTSGPAVVFVHGIGDRAGSASFDKVTDRLPEPRRVCRYDRPGAGDSPDPTRAGRDALQLDAELDTVVQQADPSNPVVLVGHSFGSYPALTYTAGHRQRVEAVVLVEGVDPQLGLLKALGVSAWAEVPMANENLDLPAVQDQTASAVTTGSAAFADLPLTVIHRDRKIPDHWFQAQQRLAGLSTRGRFIVATNTGHEVPQENPAAVAAAING